MVRLLLQFQIGWLFVITIVGCASDMLTETPHPYAYDWPNHEPFTTQYEPFIMAYTDAYHVYPDTLGTVEMREASGLAWSLANPGMIWSHNDSGHANNLFLLDASNGEILARYSIQGTNNIDWEDIEVSWGPEKGSTYIYLADTGDNHLRRQVYDIYRFKEPVYQPEHYQQLVRVDDIRVDRIRFTYPDGSRDTEAMMVDPFTLDIFLATKRDVKSTLYVLPYPQILDTTIEIYKAGEFSFREASAAASTLDGKRAVIKNRHDIFYWERNTGESMVEMLARKPVRAPYVGEPQGEAITFDLQHNYYTLSEALNSTTPPIFYRYNIKQPNQNQQ
jgi:hypothetical protein